MDWAEFKNNVDNANCPKCHQGRFIPQRLNIDGKSINFTCNSCGRFKWIQLPLVKKQRVYLDNGVLADIVKAQQRNENDSPFQRLFQSLRRGMESEVLTCPLSPITRSEYEFRGKEGFEQSYEIALALGDSEHRGHSEIQDVQLQRALEDYVKGIPAAINRTPPSLDAFSESPHRWTHNVNFFLNYRTPEDLIEERHTNKLHVHGGLIDVANQYETDALEFKDVVQEELKGFGRAIWASHQYALSQWNTNPLGLFTTFEVLISTPNCFQRFPARTSTDIGV